jgi:hypothetical protein
LKLKEAGLIDKWIDAFLPMHPKCSDNKHNHKTEKKPLTRLSLGHLSGAFVILLIGYLVTIFVCIGELAIAAYYRRQRR